MPDSSNEPVKFKKRGAIFSTSRSTVVIQNDQLAYKGGIVNLNSLASVESSLQAGISDYATTAAGGSSLGTFKLTLADRQGNQVTIPIGEWKDEYKLFAIVSQYANKSGAVVNDAAAKSFEKANADTKTAN